MLIVSTWERVSQYQRFYTVFGLALFLFGPLEGSSGTLDKSFRVLCELTENQEFLSFVRWIMVSFEEPQFGVNGKTF